MGSSTWSFGIRAMPFPIEDKHCSVVLFMSDEAVLHVELIATEELDDARLAAEYQAAIAKPSDERPAGPPRKIVVSGGALAKRVRGFAKGARVEVGPTLEIDLAFADLVDHLAGPAATARAAYADTPEVWRTELLALGEDLAEAEPWALFPADETLSLRAPALGLDDARLLVMGQGGESFGFLVFRSAEDHARFDVIARGGAPAGLGAPRCVGVDVEELALGEEPPRPLPIVTVLEGEGPAEVTDDDRRVAVAVGEALLALVAEHEDALERAAEDDAALPALSGRYAVEVLAETITVGVSTRVDEGEPEPV
jgi:hypothetical protein